MNGFLPLAVVMVSRLLSTMKRRSREMFAGALVLATHKAEKSAAQ
jgi:hypothetical protein